MNDEIMSEQIEEFFRGSVHLSSKREQERNNLSYRNTLLKEAKRLQEKQHLENAILLQKANIRS